MSAHGNARNCAVEPGASGEAPLRGFRRPSRWQCGWVMWLFLVASVSASLGAAPMERSFWVHASLGLFTQRNYFGTNFPATAAPTQPQVEKAARLLTESYAANRLYLIYHREMPAEDARRVFLWWRQACPKEVEIIPALVLRMYDRAQTPVFATNELAALADFFRDQINPRQLAIYDIYSRRDQGAALTVLSRRWPSGLIRVGLQPGEALDLPFVAAVEDTWSALCHGTENERAWSQPGFGAETLRKWVLARNPSPQPIAWDLVTVAWDYSATKRGGYPGYDDADKNMPLPAGRNRAALKLIREGAQASSLAGFSSDLYILHENSRSAPHDGRTKSFYECLKRGEDYRGYYGTPFQEIVTLYRGLRDGGE